MKSTPPAEVSGKIEPERPEDKDRGRILVQLARSEISLRLGRHFPLPRIEGNWLEEQGACFVTLTSEGELRGCIGTLEAHRPLGIDVRENAVSAAFRDPRFMPLGIEELEEVRIEVSVLSLPERMVARSEDEALTALRPGIDGVIFEYSRYRSTFLPQVWEQLPDPVQFLAHLRHKAGLPADFWAEGVRLSRYTVQKWKE